MSDAKAVKTEIQVKYDSLLEFSSVARNLMGKYTSVTQGIRIQNQNQPNERIILSAPDEGYFFDCTWERAAFVGEGDRSNYRSQNGKTKFFFDLVEDISELDFFGGFKGMAVAAFDVIPLEGEEEGSLDTKTDRVVRAFSERFIGESLFSLPGSPEDAGVILDRQEGNFQLHLQFGPFRPRKDIEERDLVVFGPPGKGPLSPGWALVPSLLVRTEVVYSGKDVNHDTFLRCDEKRRDIVEQISESSESLLNDGR